MFWEIYTDLCQKHGLSPNAVAKQLSITSGTVTGWKQGRAPQNANLKAIADYFGVSVNHLLGKEGAVSSTPQTEPRQSRPAIRIPVYERLTRKTFIEVAGVSNYQPTAKKTPPNHLVSGVSAAIPFDLIYDAKEYEEYPADQAGDALYTAIRLHDDSMAPRMMAGDVVIVRLQETVNDGDIAIVYPENVAICRKIKKTPEGILLLATNQDFEPIFCSENQLATNEIRILGTVVELRAKFDSV